MPSLGDDVPRRCRSGVEDRLDVDRVEALDAGSHQRRPRLQVQGGEPSIDGIINAQGGEGRAALVGPGWTPKWSRLHERAQRAGPQPGGRALGMAQGSGLRCTRCQRESGGALREPAVAQGCEQGEAVQPGAVQLTEGGSQGGVVVLRGRGFQDGRGTPP